MIAETSLDNIKVLDTASNATMSGTSKGLENGVLDGSENMKFVGKIRWFRILFVARSRYYWEFRWIFSALCIGHKWIWRWHFLFASSFGSPVRFQPDPSDTSNCPLLTGYVWCMRSLPRKIWKKKVSQPVKIAKLVIFFREMAGCIPWASRCTYRGANNTNSAMGRQWNGWGMLEWRWFFLGDQFQLFRKKKKNLLWMCAWRSTKKIRSFEPRRSTIFMGFLGRFWCSGSV